MTSLTDQEARLYDRQLRLWGVEAQQRLRQAKVLLFGFTGVQAEICKNLVLAGVCSVTINDIQVCNMNDMGVNFFLDESCLGKNRAEAAFPRIRELNPLVSVSTTTISSVTEIDFTLYHLCCFSGVPLPTCWFVC